MTETPHTPNKGGRVIVWALLAICLSPPLLAAALYYFAPQGTLGDASHGTLLNDLQPLPDITLSPTQDRGYGHLHGKWSMLYLGDSGCADPCQEELQRMRTAWLSLGSRAQRVQRIYILPSPVPPGTELTTLLRGQWIWRLPAPSARIRALFRGGSLVIIDPRGVPVLRYTHEVSAKQIAKDLKRLLRASRIG